VDFAQTDAYRDVLLELDLAAEVDADRPEGVAYDLDELFDEVNAAYFGGQMARPRLAWTDRLTSRRFGHFDPQRDRVVISRTLDSESVPRFVVEYIVYHELLHRKLGSKWAGTRSRSHTPEFRREERKFARWQEAEKWMREPKGR
jgi:predicted SprT family Zn-dependent metalloprotease